MTEKRDLEDEALERFFEAGRAEAPLPSAALVERVVQDALAVQAAARAPATPAPHRGPIAGLLAALGGWPAVAGLATAAVAGVMIGVAAPETVETLTGGALAVDTGYDLDDLLPSYAELLEEG